MVNGRVEKNQFQRLGIHEAEIIHVHKPPQFGRYVKIRADVCQKNPGIHKIGLAFVFVRTQVRNQAIARIERDTCTCKPNALAVPQAKDSAGKFGKIVNGVEASGATAFGMSRAGRIKRGSFESYPVFVDGKLKCRHLSIDGDGASGDAIEAIIPKRLVKSMRQIYGADVAVSRPSNVDGMDAVRMQNALRENRANRGGADQKTIVVVMNGGVVFIVVNAELRRVTLKEEVLAINVSDDHLLIPEFHGIQTAVGVFFEKVEIGEIVLPAV